MDLLSDSELADAVSALLPGFHALWTSMAVASPGRSGAKHLEEKPVIQWLEPVAKDYASRAAVLAAYRSVALLERGPGISLHGLIAMCCKLALEVAEPFAASFPTPADKLRLFLFLADPAQRFFAHDGRSSCSAASAGRSWIADERALSRAASHAALPQLQAAPAVKTAIAPPLSLQHASPAIPVDGLAGTSSASQSEWRGAVAQLDELLHSLSGAVFASPLPARALSATTAVATGTAAVAVASPAVSAAGSVRAATADGHREPRLSAYEQEQALLARAADAEAAVLAPAADRLAHGASSTLSGSVAPEPETASRARLGALLDSAAAAVGLLASRRGLDGDAARRVEPTPAAAAAAAAGSDGAASAAVADAAHPATAAALLGSNSQLPLQYADMQPAATPAVSQIESRSGVGATTGLEQLPAPLSRQRLTASGDDVAAFVQRRRASIAGTSPTSSAAAAVPPASGFASAAGAGAGTGSIPRGRRLSTSSAASAGAAVLGSRPGAGRVVVGRGAGAAAGAAVGLVDHDVQSSPLSSDAGSAGAAALVAGYGAWLTKHNRSRSRSASAAGGAGDAAAAAAAAAGTGSSSSSGPFVPAGSSRQQDAPAQPSAPTMHGDESSYDWQVPVDRALSVGDVLKAAHCIDVRAADAALHGLFHRYALYGDRARYSVGTSSSGAVALGATVAAVAATRPYGESSAYGVVVPRAHSHESPRSDDMHAHAFTHGHGEGTAASGAARDSRLLAGQFVKLCSDAGIIGRGGAGAGVVRRGDLEVVFMSALSLVQHVIESQDQQAQQGHQHQHTDGHRERSSSRGRSSSAGGASSAGAAGGYSQREATRAIISRGIDFGSFVHALALLAVKRFCAPAGAAAAVAGAGAAAAGAVAMSESAASAAVRAGADSITAVAAQEEAAVRRFYSNRNQPLPRVPQVGHDALDALAGRDTSALAAAAALYADLGLVLVDDSDPGSHTSHGGAGAGIESGLLSPSWAVAADVAVLPVPASLLSSSMALRLLLVRCMLPLAARIGLVASTGAVVRPLRILPSASAAPGSSSAGEEGPTGRSVSTSRRGSLARRSAAATEAQSPAEALAAVEAPHSDASDRAAVSRLALPRSRSSSVTKHAGTAAASGAQAAKAAAVPPLAHAQRMHLAASDHAADYDPSHAYAARVQLWEPDRRAAAESASPPAALPTGGEGLPSVAPAAEGELPSAVLTELGETLRALAAAEAGTGATLESIAGPEHQSVLPSLHWPASSIFDAATSFASVPASRVHADPRATVKGLLLLPPRSVSEALSFVTASLDGLSVFGARLTSPSVAGPSVAARLAGRSQAAPAERSFPTPAPASKPGGGASASGSVAPAAAPASAPGSAERAVAALIAAQTGMAELPEDNGAADKTAAEAAAATAAAHANNTIALTAQQRVGLLSAASASASAADATALASTAAAAAALPVAPAPVPLPSLGSLLGHTATRTPAPTFARNRQFASRRQGEASGSRSRSRSMGAHERSSSVKSANRSVANLEAATQSLVSALDASGGSGLHATNKPAHLRAVALVLAAQDAVATLQRRRQARRNSAAASETGSSASTPTTATSPHTGVSLPGDGYGEGANQGEGSAADSPASAGAASLASAPGRLGTGVSDSDARAGNVAGSDVQSSAAGAAGTRGRSSARRRQQQQQKVVELSSSRPRSRSRSGASATRSTAAASAAASDVRAHSAQRRRHLPPPLVPFGSTAERGLAWGGGHSGTPHVATGHFHAAGEARVAESDAAHHQLQQPAVTLLAAPATSSDATHVEGATAAAAAAPIPIVPRSVALPVAAASPAAPAPSSEAPDAGAHRASPVAAAELAAAPLRPSPAVDASSSAPAAVTATSPADVAAAVTSESCGPAHAGQTLGPDGEPLVRAARLSLRQQLSPPHRDSSASAALAGFVNTPAPARQARRPAGRAAAFGSGAIAASPGDDDADADDAGASAATPPVPSTDKAQREWERRFLAGGQQPTSDDEADDDHDDNEESSADVHEQGEAAAQEQAGRAQHTTAGGSGRRFIRTRAQPVWSPTAGATGLAATTESTKRDDSEGGGKSSADGGAVVAAAAAPVVDAGAGQQRGRRRSSGLGVRFSPSSAASPSADHGHTTPSAVTGDSPHGFARAAPRRRADALSPDASGHAAGAVSQTPHVSRRRSALSRSLASKAVVGNSHGGAGAARAAVLPETPAAARDGGSADSAASSPDRRALNSSVAELLASPDDASRGAAGDGQGHDGAGDSDGEGEYEFVRVPHSSAAGGAAGGSGVLQHHSYGGGSTGGMSAAGTTAASSSGLGAGAGGHDYSSFSHHAAMLATPGAIIAVPRRRSIMPQTARKAPASAADAGSIVDASAASTSVASHGLHEQKPEHHHVHWFQQPPEEQHLEHDAAAAELSPGAEAAQWLQRYRAQQAEYAQAAAPGSEGAAHLLPPGAHEQQHQQHHWHQSATHHGLSPPAGAGTYYGGGSPEGMVASSGAAVDAASAASPDALRSSRNFARSLQAAAAEDMHAFPPRQGTPQVLGAESSSFVDHNAPAAQAGNGHFESTAANFSQVQPYSHSSGHGLLQSPLVLQAQHLALPVIAPGPAASEEFHPSQLLDHGPHSQLHPHGSRRGTAVLAASTPHEFDFAPGRLAEAAAAGSALAQELEFDFAPLPAPAVQLTAAQALGATLQRSTARSTQAPAELPAPAAPDLHSPVLLSFPVAAASATGVAAGVGQGPSAVPPSPSLVPFPMDWGVATAAFGAGLTPLHQAGSGLPAADMLANSVLALPAQAAMAVAVGSAAALAGDERSGASFDGIGLLAGSSASVFASGGDDDGTPWPSHLPPQHALGGSSGQHVRSAGHGPLSASAVSSSLTSPSLLTRMMRQGSDAAAAEAGAFETSQLGEGDGASRDTAAVALVPVAVGSMPPSSPTTLLPARGASESIMRSPAFEMAPAGGTAAPVRASLDAAMLDAVTAAARAVLGAAAGGFARAYAAPAAPAPAAPAPAASAPAALAPAVVAPALLSPGAGAGAGARSSLLTGGLFSLSESSDDADADAEAGAEADADAAADAGASGVSAQAAAPCAAAARVDADDSARSSSSTASASAALHMLSGVGADGAPSQDAADYRAAVTDSDSALTAALMHGHSSKQWASPPPSSSARHETAPSAVDYASAVKAVGPAQRRMLRTPHAAPPALLPSQLPWQLLARARAGHAEALRLAESAGAGGDDEADEGTGAGNGAQQQFTRSQPFTDETLAAASVLPEAAAEAPASSPADAPAWGPEEQAVYDEAYAYVLASGVHERVAQVEEEDQQAGTEFDEQGDGYDESAAEGNDLVYDDGHDVLRARDAELETALPLGSEDVYEWSAAAAPAGLAPLSPPQQQQQSYGHLSHLHDRHHQAPRAFSFDAQSEQSDSEPPAAPAAALLEEADDDAAAAMAPPVSTASLQGSARELWRDEQRLPSARSWRGSGSGAATGRAAMHMPALPPSSAAEGRRAVGHGAAAAPRAVDASIRSAGGSPAPAPSRAARGAALPLRTTVTPQRAGGGRGGVTEVGTGSPFASPAQAAAFAARTSPSVSRSHGVTASGTGSLRSEHPGPGAASGMHASPARGGGGAAGEGSRVSKARSGALWAQVLGE